MYQSCLLCKLLADEYNIDHIKVIVLRCFRWWGQYRSPDMTVWYDHVSDVLRRVSDMLSVPATELGSALVSDFTVTRGMELPIFVCLTTTTKGMARAFYAPQKISGEGFLCSPKNFRGAYSRRVVRPSVSQSVCTSRIRVRPITLLF